MEYPKPIMSQAALKKMGFPQPFLNRAYHHPTRRIAWKANPLAGENGVICYDTAELESFRIEEINTEKKVMKLERRLARV